MNLHVNLIVDSEVRNSSRVSRNFLVKATVTSAAVLALVFVVVVFVGSHFARQAMLFSEQERKQLDPVFRSVSDLRRQLAELQDMTNAITVWSRTRPDWPSLLAGLQSVVPANIQLTRMTVNENINQVDNTPARVVTLYIQGRAAGEHADRDVQELEKSLKEKPPFNGFVEHAEVKQFEAAKNEAQENLRVFDLECRFKILKLFQPVKVRPKDSK